MYTRYSFFTYMVSLTLSHPNILTTSKRPCVKGTTCFLSTFTHTICLKYPASPSDIGLIDI